MFLPTRLKIQKALNVEHFSVFECLKHCLHFPYLEAVSENIVVRVANMMEIQGKFIYFKWLIVSWFLRAFLLLNIVR